MSRTKKKFQGWGVFLFSPEGVISHISYLDLLLVTNDASFTGPKESWLSQKGS